jgi:ribonuclease D
MEMSAANRSPHCSLLLPSCYHPAVLDRLKPRWVDTASAVAEVADACALEGRFALDTEADSLHSYFHKVCLIQVSAGDRHFLVDPLALSRDDLQPLWRVAGDRALTVVMHGADYDLRVLDRDFGTRVRGLEDTQIMAQLLGEPKTGLAVLLERGFEVRLDKRHQRADWGQRPLPDALLSYAAADTAFLVGLADRMRSRLEELGRWSWLEEEARRLEDVRFEESEPDPLAFERIKGARALTGAARDRLHTLYEWREAVARRRDLPPFKVMSNRPMLELAEDPPVDVDGVARVQGLGPRFARRFGAEVVGVLRRQRSAPPRQRQPRAERISAEVQARIRRLSAVRDQIAAELGLVPGLVCSKAVLQELATCRPDLQELERRGLRGWRLELLGERFVIALEAS